jgi:hypothetical protein
MRVGHRALRLALAASAVLVCVGALSLSAWSGAPNWSNADSLFYQSMSYELDGMSAAGARARVFDSPLAVPAIKVEPSVASRAWQNFESQFSRRRWLVPALTAALRPIAGIRALPDVAILGYLVFGLALSLLLARRFALAPAVAVVVFCLASGTVRNWCVRPMTDSWGLAMLSLALLGAMVVLKRGERWLALWVVVMVIMSFTRDLAIIPLAGLALLIIQSREPGQRRLAALLAVTGVLATIPVYLLFGSSLRLTLAFQMNAFEVPSPTHATWSYVLAHYPSLFAETVREDGAYLLSHVIVAITWLTGLAGLFIRRGNREPLAVLMRGSVIGWVLLFALDPDFSEFRYELTIVPAVAVGLCLLISYAAEWLRIGSPAGPTLEPAASPSMRGA